MDTTKLTPNHLMMNSHAIQSEVKKVAGEINYFYGGVTKPRPVLAICVLDGAFMFFSDLVRHFDFPIETAFIKTDSYGEEMRSSGVVSVSSNVPDVDGRDVLIVDDIVDTGVTMVRLIELFRGARSIETCSFLIKEVVSERTLVDFYGVEIPDDWFIYGYGLDFKGEYRNLTDIMFIRR